MRNTSWLVLIALCCALLLSSCVATQTRGGKQQVIKFTAANVEDNNHSLSSTSGVTRSDRKDFNGNYAVAKSSLDSLALLKQQRDQNLHDAKPVRAKYAEYDQNRTNVGARVTRQWNDVNNTISMIRRLTILVSDQQVLLAQTRTSWASINATWTPLKKKVEEFNEQLKGINADEESQRGWYLGAMPQANRYAKTDAEKQLLAELEERARKELKVAAEVPPPPAPPQPRSLTVAQEEEGHSAQPGSALPPAPSIKRAGETPVGQSAVKKQPTPSGCIEYDATARKIIFSGCGAELLKSQYSYQVWLPGLVENPSPGDKGFTYKASSAPLNKTQFIFPRTLNTGLVEVKGKITITW